MASIKRRRFTSIHDVLILPLTSPASVECFMFLWSWHNQDQIHDGRSEALPCHPSGMQTMTEKKSHKFTFWIFRHISSSSHHHKKLILLHTVMHFICNSAGLKRMLNAEEGSIEFREKNSQKISFIVYELLSGSTTGLKNSNGIWRKVTVRASKRMSLGYSVCM